MNFEQFKLNASGLIPVIAQDKDKNVLMLAYMNKESFSLTIKSGYMHYFSRSRQTLWKKGESSGNFQKVINLKIDCDQDTILAIVDQNGPACHTGEKNCFFTDIN